jgi:hypothetical protein
MNEHKRQEKHKYQNRVTFEQVSSTGEILGGDVWYQNYDSKAAQITDGFAVHQAISEAIKGVQMKKGEEGLELLKQQGRK